MVRGRTQIRSGSRRVLRGHVRGVAAARPPGGIPGRWRCDGSFPRRSAAVRLAPDPTMPRTRPRPAVSPGHGQAVSRAVPSRRGREPLRCSRLNGESGSRWSPLRSVGGLPEEYRRRGPEVVGHGEVARRRGRGSRCPLARPGSRRWGSRRFSARSRRAPGRSRSPTPTTARRCWRPTRLWSARLCGR